MVLKLNTDRLFDGRIPTRAELCKREDYFFFLSRTVMFEQEMLQNIKQQENI